MRTFQAARQCRRFGAVFLLAALLVGGAAHAAPGRAGDVRESLELLRAYLTGMRDERGEAPAEGPREFRLERQQGETVTAEVAPVERLYTMLRHCRRASYSVSYGDRRNPKLAQGQQLWECLGEGAEDKSVKVTARTSDGKTIEAVTALLGGPLYWPGPAPGPMSRPTEAEASEFAASKATALAFLDELTTGAAPAAPGKLELWQQREKRPISMDRLREIVGPCERDGVWRDSIELDGVSRAGVGVRWKCDKRSSAWGDLSAILLVKDGAVDHFYLSPFLDYQIPPSAADRK